jgi:xylan 1,4-beta-xylosidase
MGMSSRSSKARFLLGATLVSACARPNPQPASPARSVVYENPVIAGDYPDPSVIRVGNAYWATATSSEWAPPFPLLRSTDLVNWQVMGTVLPRPPAWASASFWAPEIAAFGGRYFVYYTARKRGGPLCVAVAIASTPGGPYQDHGPLVCQEVGSIDAMPITDEDGARYLVWKEDGNSKKLPTPLWAQRLSVDGTRLEGEPTEILRNDQPWEAQLVEGPFLLRRGPWFYLFYSGNACCGRNCDYALGVARAPKLLGPWEKNPANPILRANTAWKCPGHGSIVTDPAGHDYLLYHAYHPDDSVYVGRQALLDRVEWGAEGWPTINGGAGPSRRAAAPAGVPGRSIESSFADEFRARELPGWQWPQANEPSIRVDLTEGGWLVLSSKPERAEDPVGAVLARSTTTGNYVATTRVATAGQAEGSWAGLSAYGNEANGTGIAMRNGRVVLWRRTKGVHETEADLAAPGGAFVHLRLTARDGHRFRFAVSADGRAWTDVGGEVSGEHLPPWDLGVRVAVTAGGGPDAAARFDWMRIEPVR